MKVIDGIRGKVALLLAISPLFVLDVNAHAQDYQNSNTPKANLTSFEQVPAVNTTGHGLFEVEINQDSTISFKLSYTDMSSPVVQAHIHFGASKTNGGVMVFLCGGSTQPCPASGAITGTLTAADVSTLPVSNTDSVIPQGINPGDFSGLVNAIRTGNAYVNVHTQNFPNGEIRGQVQIYHR
jgi:hypothetical protein